MGGLPVDLARRERRKPAWELALLYPDQGAWNDEDYLELDSNRFIEYSDGRLEFLPMPTRSHQWTVLFLVNALRVFIGERSLGVAVQAPFPVRISENRYREPDVAFLSRKNLHRDGERFWDGADLVMEVVSPNSAARDRVKKRREYARAGIPEYWLVDPAQRTITVLTLRHESYVVHGEFGKGELATSRLLPGFQVSVKEALEAR